LIRCAVQCPWHGNHSITLLLERKK
jgi:hypothetical protein